VRDPARRRAPLLADALGPVDHDVVVAHSLLVLPLAIELRHRRPGTRVVFDAHEVFDEQRDSLRSRAVRRYWRRVGDEFVPQADAVATVTPRIAHALRVRHGLDFTPTVLYNACTYRSQRGKTGLLRALYSIDMPEVALCQGGILPGRGLEDFAEAAPILRRQGVAVVFLGTGPDRYIDELRSRSKGAAHIGKAVPQDVLLDYTADADLGLVSNRGAGLNNTAGGPNRLFEYIQARVPVLSHEHDGIRDVLSETGTGWTVPWLGGRQLASLVLAKLDEARALPPERLEEAARAFSWESQERSLLTLAGGPC
jgi:glycosyltransferase involved in cell wall biosynthesis